MKACNLNLKPNYLNDTVKWDIQGIDPDTNKIFLKEHREYDKLWNGEFLPLVDMVNLITTNTLACSLLRKGYYWRKIYVDGKLFSII